MEHLYLKSFFFSYYFFCYRKSNSLKNKTPFLWIDETSVYYNDNETSTVTIKHDINYHEDGKWHYLVVNVNGATGELHFIVDVVSSLPAKISRVSFNLKYVFQIHCRLYRIRFFIAFILFQIGFKKKINILEFLSAS